MILHLWMQDVYKMPYLMLPAIVWIVSVFVKYFDAINVFGMVFYNYLSIYTRGTYFKRCNLWNLSKNYNWSSSFIIRDVDSLITFSIFTGFCFIKKYNNKIKIIALKFLLNFSWMIYINGVHKNLKCKIVHLSFSCACHVLV